MLLLSLTLLALSQSSANHTISTDGASKNAKLRLLPLMIESAELVADSPKAQQLRILLAARETAGGELALGKCQGNNVDVVRLVNTEEGFARFRAAVTVQEYAYKEINVRRDAKLGITYLFQVRGGGKVLTGLWSLEPGDEDAFVALCQTD